MSYTNKEFIVDTDASDIGLGGVLSQRNGDQEVVIAYFSKSLSKPERNYCVTRRELVTVVKSLHHFSKYLLGRKFELRRNFESRKVVELWGLIKRELLLTTHNRMEWWNDLIRYWRDTWQKSGNAIGTSIYNRFCCHNESAIHESTSVTPAFVNFGRELRLPADLITGIPPVAPRSITDYANDLGNKMNDIYHHIRQSGQQMSDKMKTRY